MSEYRKQLINQIIAEARLKHLKELARRCKCNT